MTTTDVEDSATAETFCGPALGAEYNKLHMILIPLLKNYKIPASRSCNVRLVENGPIAIVSAARLIE